MKTFIKKLFSLMFNRWTVRLLYLLILCTVVFIICPIIAIGGWYPLANLWAQWLTLIGIIVLWLCYAFYKKLKKNDAEKNFFTALLKTKSAVPKDHADHEIEKIEKNFIKAISTLKKASKRIGSRFNLYDMPWYVIIGPPGSGKTTALVNSGLKFPLAENNQTQSIKGISGTRDCDWWFSDQAVLIDTSGRYTTQDSQKEHDKKSWLGFLKLLKKFRARQPINGVIIAVSIHDMLNKDEFQRKQEANNIRQRLVELQENLAVNFPVYLMLTKVDMIDGFDAFFDHYSDTDREQIWGFELSEPPELAQLQAGFDNLTHTLNTMLVPIMGYHKSVDDVKSVCSFPKQMQAISSELASYIYSIFAQSYYNSSINLRGVYLTSGTQHGAPIDRLMNKVANNQHRLINTQGKAFFIANLFQKRIFPERDLVSTDQKLELRFKVFNIVAASSIVTVTVLLITAWGMTYSNSINKIDKALTDLSTIETRVAAIEANDTDPLTVIPLLDELVSIMAQFSDDKSLWHLGLSQSEKITTQIDQAYRQLLRKGLLARLMLHSENKLIDSLNHEINQLSPKPLSSDSNNYLYAALRNYLLLSHNERYHGDDINAFYRLDWLHPISNQLTEEQYNRISQHLDELFAQQPLPLPIVFDEALIQRVRDTILPTSVEKRVISRIERLNFAAEPFSVDKVAGEILSQKVFQFSNGQPLTHSLPSAYTKTAYLQLMATDFKALIDDVINEHWVLDTPPYNNEDKSVIYQKVKTIYLQNYRKYYNELLTTLTLKRFNNYREGAAMADLLASSESPLIKLLEAVRQQTQLTVDTSIVKAIENKASSNASERLQTLLGYQSEPVTLTNNANIDIVTQHFSPLHQLVQPQGETEIQEISVITEQFAKFYHLLEELTLAQNNRAIDPALSAKLASLLTETQLLAQQQPILFMRPMLQAMADSTKKLASNDIMTHINQQWSDNIRGFCENAIDQRFPFVKHSPKSVSIADFNEFFGYDGMMDQFFNDHLAKYVNTQTTPWSVYEEHQNNVTVSSTSLKAFEQAKKIRQAFFRPGSKTLASSFTLEPITLSPQLRGVLIHIEGQSDLYEFGPLTTKKLIWPNQQQANEQQGGAFIEFRHINGDIETLSASGEWAWFRLLSKSQIRYNSNNGSYNIRFSTEHLNASYRLVPTTAYNPYGLFKAMKFLCPTTI